MQDPYVGVVFDGTVTFVGQEFFRAFVATWRDQPVTQRYSISIYERPSARWGSLVWIEYLHRRVYSAFLSPGRRDHVRLAGTEAARIAFDNIVQTDMDRLMFKDPDLAPDELY